jgi:hypothetical protein
MGQVKMIYLPHKKRKYTKLKNLAQRNYCDLEKSVAITFTKGGILCDMIRYDYYLRLGVK